MAEKSMDDPIAWHPAPRPVLGKAINMEVLISQIKVNKDLLSPEQLRRVMEIHRVNVAAFNKDIAGGYDNNVSPCFIQQKGRAKHKPLQ